MDLYLLAELKTISLKVTTVDMQKPPPDFRYELQTRICIMHERVNCAKKLNVEILLVFCCFSYIRNVMCMR